MCERRGGQARVEPDERVGIGDRFEMMPAHGVLDLLARGVDDLRGVNPFRLGRHRAGVDARHVEDVFEQPRETLDLGEDDVALLAPVGVTEP